jgi:hypothetical protein
MKPKSVVRAGRKGSILAALSGSPDSKLSKQLTKMYVDGFLEATRQLFVERGDIETWQTPYTYTDTVTEARRALEQQLKNGITKWKSEQQKAVPDHIIQ